MWIFHLPQIFEVEPRISEVEHQNCEASIKYLVLTEMPVLFFIFHVGVDTGCMPAKFAVAASCNLTALLSIGLRCLDVMR